MSFNHQQQPLPLDDPNYESGGRGVIVLTLAAALTTLAYIFTRFIRLIIKRKG
jgi:hypothetical protein